MELLGYATRTLRQKADMKRERNVLTVYLLRAWLTQSSGTCSVAQAQQVDCWLSLKIVWQYPQGKIVCGGHSYLYVMYIYMIL
jgi:hypothetical protein